MSRLHLHRYQEHARDWLLGHDRAALFLDMGLGKTAITLSALTPDHLPALVVAPKRVAENVWHTEGSLWRPDLRVSVVKGTPAQRRRALDRRADVYVISRDNIGDLLDPPRTYATVIMDELSIFKGRGVRWKQMAKVAAPARHRWGLTGTPTPNGLMDLWAQVALLDGGARLGKNITTYRNRYFFAANRLPVSGVVTEWAPREGAEAAIHQKLEDLAVSMTLDGVGLEVPPMTINRVAVTLPPKARQVYRRMKNDLVVRMDILGDGAAYSAASAGVLSNRLSQITAGFLYDDVEDRPVGPDGEPGAATATPLHQEKIKALREIVDGTGSPVLVFHRYQWEREAVLAEFPEAVTTDHPTFAEDWNAGRVPLLLAHPASAGHGLNLQHGGHTIVWLSPTWSLEEWQQANKRLARQGQKNPVMVHVITVPNSIDEAILEALVGKASVQQALIDHLESPL